MNVVSLLLKYLIYIPLVITLALWIALRGAYWYQLSALPKENIPAYNSLSDEIITVKSISLGAGKLLDMPRISPEALAYEVVFNDKKLADLLQNFTLARLGAKAILHRNGNDNPDIFSQASVMIWVSGHWQSKDVLVSLLNEASYGPCCKGVVSAADFYFDKSVDELNYQELALIVALSGEAPGTSLRESSVVDKANVLIAQLQFHYPKKYPNAKLLIAPILSNKVEAEKKHGA